MTFNTQPRRAFQVWISKPEQFISMPGECRWLRAEIAEYREDTYKWVRASEQGGMRDLRFEVLLSDTTAEDPALGAREWPTYRDVWEVNTTRALQMARILQKIEKGVEKIEAKYGPARSLGQRLLYIAQVLDVECFRITSESDNTSTWTLAEGAAQIESMVERWRRATRAKKAAA